MAAPAEAAPTGAIFDPTGFYLALDTSGTAGSVALSAGPDVLARATLDEQGRHASRLVPAVAEVMEEAGVDRHELSGLVVGEGPGSFTGVRVAAATAKGLAAGLKIPLWAVSSLAAGALNLDGAGVRYVLFDARGDRIYGACYEVGVAGLETVRPPHGGTLKEVVFGDVPTAAVFMGDGAVRHRRALEGAGHTVADAPAGVPTGDALVRFLTLQPGAPPVADPGAWEPRYVREWSR